jgi:hypothetical protein
MAFPARYPVRTPVTYWVVVTALAVVSCVPAVILVAWWPADMADHPWIVLACVGLLVWPPIHWRSTAAYRVPGGAGELEVHADRLEYHDRKARFAPVVLPLGDLCVSLGKAEGRITAGHVVTLATIRRTVATFTAGSQKLVIADSAFAEPGHLTALLADLDEVRAGRSPLGPREVRPEEPAQAQERDAYDEQLDRELDEMD